MRCVPPFGEQHEALSLVILMGVVVVVVMEWGHEGGISGDFFFLASLFCACLASGTNVFDGDNDGESAVVVWWWKGSCITAR